MVGIGLASQTGDALLSVPLLERGKFAFDLQHQARLINATSHSLKGRGTGGYKPEFFDAMLHIEGTSIGSMKRSLQLADRASLFPL